MPVISLSVYDHTGDEIYRDAANIKDPVATVGDLRTYICGGEHPAALHIAQHWQIVRSIKIESVDTGKKIEFVESDSLSKYPFDEYIFEVELMRKPKKSKQTRKNELNRASASAASAAASAPASATPQGGRRRQRRRGTRRSRRY